MVIDVLSEFPRPQQFIILQSLPTIFDRIKRRVENNAVLRRPAAREVFRLAVMASASAIIVMHNHPSGESTPSEADIKITRDLLRAGQLLKIDVVDHVVIGNPNHTSLRELGYLYQ
jgi:DNA repair protein RadC